MHHQSFSKKIIDRLRCLINKMLPDPFAGQPSIEFNIDAAQKSGILNATHAGNIGDVIYSCLFLKAYWQQTGSKVHLHLQTNVPILYSVEHPLKNILMNQRMAEQLTSLLLDQPYIAEVTVSPNQPEETTLNLNQFRQLPMNLRCGIIQGWQQLCTDLVLNPFDAWISASKLPEHKDKIIVSRTARLRSSYIDYQFLADYSKRVIFVGLPEECVRFKHETSIDCEMMTASCFKELATIFNSCQLFVGNIGFPFALAESLKCPRVLEANSTCPNVYPLSSNGRIALFQKQFEKFVRTMATI